MFRNIKGQDQVVQLLTTQINNDRVAQAYLFHGSDGVGKFITALYFGMGLNCLSSNEFRPCGVCSSCRKFLAFEHTDFSYLFPSVRLDLSLDGEIKNADGLKQYEAFIRNKIENPWLDFSWDGSTEIRKESVLMLSKRLEMSSMEARYRIVIIEDAEQMNNTTANAFLKKLEEPPSQTVIILITERLSMLLPTIISRCQQVYFKPLSPATIETILSDNFDVESAIARTAARIAGSNLKQAIRIAHDSSSQIRDLAFSLAELAFRKDELSFYNLLTKQRDFLNAGKTQELIKYLCILVNDLALLPSNPDLITNVDRMEQITQLAGSGSDLTEQARNFLIYSEDLNRKITGNVNLSLILIGLFHALTDCLHP
ncbi:MAG TPA: DNA polymerase III subunit [Candidatus Cloacimonadota bacterium]|nr:DNA polymerase III subunit [Candidatus Cloacimonadota bacterium]